MITPPKYISIKEAKELGWSIREKKRVNGELQRNYIRDLKRLPLVLSEKISNLEWKIRAMQIILIFYFIIEMFI